MTGNELIERPDWGDGERLPAVTDVSAVAAGGTILGHAAAAVATVEASLDADEYQALDTALAELPDTVKAAIRSEIALSPDSRARPVSDDIVAKFRADPAGEVLAKEWRAMTPEKVAVFHARLRRIVDAVPAADREAAAQWAEARTTAEQVAIIGALVR